MEDEHPRYELWPTAYFGGSGGGTGVTDEVALIILNSPVVSYDYFRRLYDHAAFRICADGGANRVYDVLVRHHAAKDTLDALRSAPPSLIHGDLDSLLPSVRADFEAIGVEVTEDSDQYSTDFGKAVKQIVAHMPSARDILVLGSIGGRVDQGLGLLGELYREQKKGHPSVRFWLFSESSVSTILAPGINVLHTPLKEGLIERNAGIIPLYGPSSISTQGFEWDVSDWKTEMGGNVSTSNHIVEDRVVIQTTNDVLFTVERTPDARAAA